ncbi:MAG: DUF4446 family protein [Roseburia sp.]|nr:DUF4446 family protein [Roseburia sp.]
MFRLRDYGLETDMTIVVLAGVCVIFAILIIVLLVMVSGMKRKYLVFMDGQNGRSLEESFQKKFENMDYVNEELKNISTRLNRIDANLLRTYQKIGIVKYDAFKEIGGTLSFVLVLLTKDNDGFILNSMHSNSEGCYTYIKEVKNGEVFVTLSEEERQALETAKIS